MTFSRLLKPSLLIILILFIYSIWQRVPDIDDAWIGEHAYWMSQKGFVKSELMHGITLQQEKHLVHHKFFTLNGFAFIKAFGFSLYTLKSVSLFWVSIFLLSFFLYTRKKIGRNAAWFGILLLAANALIFQYSFVYRPEILVMTLGFSSFIFLERYLENDKILNLVISGFLAGVATAGHLNGLIFVGAGVILLLWKRKPLASVIMGCASLLGIALYFYDFTEQHNVAFWFYQINDSPAFHNSKAFPESIGYLLKILREHMRFFHSPKEIVLSLLFIFSLILNFRKLWSNTIYLHYIFLLVILLSLITVHSTSKYLLLYLPFIVLIIVKGLQYKYVEYRQQESVSRNQNRQWITFLALTGLYLAVNMIYNVLISVEKFDPERNHVYTEKYFPFHESTSLLAPMTFIFNELPLYERIQGDLSIDEMYKSGAFNNKSFFDVVDTLKIDGMILTEEYFKKFGLNLVEANELKEEGFELIGKEDGLSFYKRID